MADIAVAIIVLAAGIVMLAMDESELGAMAVTASLGYIGGAFRDKPGGLDEAVRTLAREMPYPEELEGDDGEVA